MPGEQFGGYVVLRFYVLVPLIIAPISVAFAQSRNLISEIVVRGNSRVTTEAIKASMRTKLGSVFLQANLDKDRQSLLDQGFFETVEIRPTVLAGDNYKITVSVVEFPVIKEIRIVGNKAVPTADILKLVTNKPGEVFNLNLAKPITSAIADLYTKRSFFARVDDYGPMKDSPGTLNISIVEVTVGDIKIQGLTKTKPSVMRRLIRTRSGDPFNIEKWSNDYRRAYNTQWFEDLKPSADDQRELGKVDLKFDVKEGRTGLFNIGVQLDPRSNLAGILSMSETNYKGTGQGLRADFIQSTQGTGPSITLDYTNPFYDAANTAFRASLYSRILFRFQNPFQGSTLNSKNLYNERRTGSTFGFTRPVGDYLSYGVSARAENVITNNVGTTSANQYVQQDGDVGVISLSGTRNRRDVDIDPSRGDYLQIQLEPGYSNINKIGGAVGANPGILGQHAFGRAEIDYRKYYTPDKARGVDLDAPRHVFALRVRAGATTGQVPFFEQFFAGGSDTVRGYPQDRFWGRELLITNLEYRHPVQKGFSLIFFVDYGGAWGGYGTVNSLTQSDRFRLNLGYGPGLSFKTLLGPIRLDLGFNARGGSQTHFLIGNTF